MAATFRVMTLSGMKASVTYPDIALAKAAAERLHAKTGDHFNVIRLETVWTTQTLGEAMAEEESR